MATAFAHSPVAPTHSLRQQFLAPNSPPQQQRRPISRQRFIQDFSQCLFEFVIQLLPTTDEMAVKEDVRKLLERLIRTIEPDSRLLSFGSSANGFSLKNSDMDLCCLIDSGERLNAADLVTMVGDLLERETKFHVKPLPHARIPIVKLNLDPSPALPFGIACDIGFENRLALENTRLLMCYASVDPARVRTMVLFLKVWSKRRKINSPYKGTLSSYGYVLLVIYFLVHVKNPPVLPNLQQMPPPRPVPEEETHLNGHNIWFFDDVELLRQRWQSSNTDTVADLLIDFFKYYSRDFLYNTGVASIRAGLLKKDDKGWASDAADYGTARERNRLCIEDPFETDFNVARCVTKDGLYTIRGEFMRASRILQHRPERAILALAQLCEERKDETLGPPPPQPRSSFAPPRLNSIPPQTPYTVGSSPMRPNGVPVPGPEDIASPGKSQASSPVSPTSSSPNDSPARPVVIKDPSLHLPVDKLDHMAPIRGKWTSPPPPEATEEDRSAFEDRLGQSLALATASNNAPLRARERSYASSNASETQTDDERQSLAESDDVRSVKSYLEEGAVHYSREFHERERQLASLHAQQQILQQRLQQQYGVDPSSSGVNGAVQMNSRMEGGVDVKMISRLRGRPAARLAQPASPSTSTGERATPNASDRNENFTPPPRMDTHTPRRSMSFPVRNVNRFSLPAVPMSGFPNPLAAVYQARVSPTTGHMAPRYVLQAVEAQAQAQAQAQARAQAQSNVYYEAKPPQGMYRAMAGYSPQMQFASPGQLYDQVSHLYSTEASGRSRSQSRSRSRSRSPDRSPGLDAPIMIRRTSASGDCAEEPVAGPSRLPADSSVPSSPQIEHGRVYSHQHTHSSTTIVAPTPPATVHQFPITIPSAAMLPPSGATLGPRHASSQAHSQSRSRSPPFLPAQRNPPHPYAYSSQYSSPRMGAANLPPRLRADREQRAFGQQSAGHSPLLAHPTLAASPLLMSSPLLTPSQTPSPDMRHPHQQQPLRAGGRAADTLRPTSPFASRSHSSGSASPPMSCASSSQSHYYAGSSSPLSTSPPSPARSELLKNEGACAGGAGIAASPLRSPVLLLDCEVGAVSSARGFGLGLENIPEKEERGTPVPVTETEVAPPLACAPEAAPSVPVVVKQELEALPPTPAADGVDAPGQTAAEKVETTSPAPPPVSAPQVAVAETSPVVEANNTTPAEVSAVAEPAVPAEASDNKAE